MKLYWVEGEPLFSQFIELNTGKCLVVPYGQCFLSAEIFDSFFRVEEYNKQKNRLMSAKVGLY